MDGLTRPEEIDGSKAPEGAIDSERVAEPAANDQPVIPRIEPGAPPGPGAVLRAERETRGYSLDDVANALKLAPRQVEAIEADDFDALRGQTFARGFVKNYARLLGLDPDPLVARIRSSAPPTRVVLEPRSNANAEIPLAGGSQGPVVAGGLAVAALVVVAVVGTYGQWLGGDPKSREALGATANQAGVTLSQTAGMSAPPQASPLSSTLASPAFAPLGSGVDPSAAASAAAPAAAIPGASTSALAVAAPGVATTASATAPTNNANSATAMDGKQPMAAPAAAAGAKPLAGLSATQATVVAAGASSATLATAAPRPAVAKTSGTVIAFATPKPANPGETTNPNPSSGVAITKSGELAMTTLVPRPARSDKRMVLSFDEDAWVEVKDADGKVVFSQLSPAGASRTVEGKAPLSFVVGNAHHVKLKVDDKPFDIKPHIGVTVARFAVQ